MIPLMALQFGHEIQRGHTARRTGSLAPTWRLDTAFAHPPSNLIRVQPIGQGNARHRDAGAAANAVLAAKKRA